MAYITFTDSTGAATLRNGMPAPADRFAAWTPLPEPIGDTAVLAGSGETVMFRRRLQQGATFELRKITAREVSGVRPLAIAARLRAHLMAGGRCTVYCEDLDAHVYECGMAPGQIPQLRQSNATPVEFTLSLGLINLGDTAMMECYYAA